MTTVMLGPNFGQSMGDPSEVSELCHWREHSPGEKGEYLDYGGNEIVVLASARLRVTTIEMSVTG